MGDFVRVGYTFASLLALGALVWGEGAFAAQPARLPTTVVPEEQSVVLRVDPAQPAYSGSTLLRLRVNEPASSFRLHAEGIQILSLALVNSDGEPVSAMGEARTSDNKGIEDELEIRTEATLQPGSYQLTFEFANEYNGNAVGLYRTDFREEAYAFTQFEADDAREAFPCFDEPSFKIPFQLILEVPTGQTAVSNTPVIATEQVGGRDRVTFAKTKPLPTYLLTVAVGPFDSVEMPGMGVPSRIYTPKGQAHLAQIAVDVSPPLLQALEAYFGSPFPTPSSISLPSPSTGQARWNILGRLPTPIDFSCKTQNARV